MPQKTAQPPVSATDLAPMVKHIRYETEVVALSYERWCELDGVYRPYEERVTCASFGNAFYVSTRALIDFFNNTRGPNWAPPGMIAADYCAGWTDVDGGTELAQLKNVKQAVNERVAHISVMRERNPLLIPSHHDLRTWVDAVTRAFSAKLQGTKWAPKFHASLDDALTHVRTADSLGRAR
jgi:hypothetical protein